MRKTIIAASAAALLALSACGSDDGGVNVDSATDAVATEVDKLTEGAGNAADDAKSQLDGEGSDAEGSEGAEGEGAEGEGAEGSEGADGEGAEGADAEGSEGADGESAEGEGAGSASGAEGETAAIALPDGSEVQAPAGIAQKYQEIEAASGHLGAPTGEAQAVAGGQMLEFEGGTIVQNPDGEAFLVQGEILKEYTSNGGPEGELGFPTTDETPNEGGFISTFDNGEITWDVAAEQADVQQN